jgi:tetratricopeptide (TPR) repeat protein
MIKTPICKLIAITLPCWIVLAAGAQNLPSLEETKSFWKDPTFVKEFMGSYGFNTENQPKVTPEEAKLLGTVAQQLSTSPQAAIDALQAAIKPDSSAVLDFALGTALLQAQKYADAEIHLKKAIEKFPNYLYAHKNLGLAYVQQSKYEALIPELTKTLELGGESSVVYGLLGYAYLSSGHYLPAEIAYGKALLFEPDKVEWKAGLAECLRLENKDRESIAAFGELIRTDPDEIKYWLGQAYSYTALGENRSAARNYEVVRRMGKADVRVLNWLGVYYLNQKMYAEARKAFVEAFNADPKKDPDGMLHSIETLVVYGSPKEAETMLDQVRQESAGKMTDEQNLRLLRLTAQIQLATGKEADAVKTLEAVLKQDPTDGQSMLILGNYQAGEATKDPEHAADHIARAEMEFELATHRPDVKREALIAWARLLVDHSEYSRAIPLLRQAQEIKSTENVARYLDQLEQIVKNQL